MKNMFRKITALVLSLCMIAGMTGLPVTAYAEGLDDAAIVATDKDALAVGFADGDSAEGVTGNLILVTTGASGSGIVWLSDTPEVIDNDGTVTRPDSEAEDAKINLTATITYGEAEDTKAFTVTVLKAQAELSDSEIVADDQDGLAIGFAEGDSADSVTGDLTLPLTGVLGSAITWLSDTSEIIAHDGAVTRPDADAEDAEVALTATITYGEAEDTKVFTVTVLKEQTDEGEPQMLFGPMSVTWVGDGSAGSPYEVSSAAHLANIPNQGLDKHYIQTENIDLVEAGYTNWTPIGDSINLFAGSYNGDNKTISNLTINDGTSTYVGLFGEVDSGGTLTNITLENVSVNSTIESGCVGGLAGSNFGSISQCSSDGSVTGGDRASTGGLVGLNYISGTVSQCSSDGTVTSGDVARVGGLAGGNYGAISASTSGANVNGGDYSSAGGLIGSINSVGVSGSSISNSNSTGNVRGGADADVGGLVGYRRGSFTASVSITNSHSTGFIEGGSGATVGGLIGYDIITTISLDSIAVTAPANKLTYSWGDQLDITGLEVKGYYAGGNTAVLPITTGHISGFSSSEPVGSQALTISFGGKATGYTVTITPPVWEGNGSEGSPYKVTSPAHLNEIRTKGLGAYYIQTANIDLTGINWTPIGVNAPSTARFNGSYNGNGHTISNLTIETDTDTVNTVGLFGVVGDDGRLNNIALENASIHATHTSGVSTNVGSLVGYNRGTISNCKVEAEVIGGRYASVGGLAGSNQGSISQSCSAATVGGKASTHLGGLVGYNSGITKTGTIDQCSSSGSVSVEDPPDVGPRMGGLVGTISSNAAIANSFSTADVNLQSTSVPVSMGGLVGECYSAKPTITGCYSTGEVVNLTTHIQSYTGGLIGYFYEGPVVENCYSTGDVIGLRRAGGIAGALHGSTLKNCYSTGTVSGGHGVGGIAGVNALGLIENCYTTSLVTGSGEDVGGIVGLTNSIVRNTAALNSSVNEGSNTGRIVGRVDAGAAISGNMAWAFMPINGVVSIAVGADDDNNGVSLRYAQMCQEDTWTPFIEAQDGSGNAIWDFAEGSLPVLSGVGGEQSGSFPQYLVGYELVSISPAGGITVPYGTTLSQALAALPGNTTVVDVNSQTYAAALNWMITDYAGDTPGSYTATGTFELPAGVEQTIPATELKVTTTVTVQAAIYSLTITADTGGSITVGASGNYGAGTVIDISASPASGYRFDKWTTSNGGTFGNANSASTTFTAPANATIVTATFTTVGGGSSGGGTPSTPAAPEYKADVKAENGAEATLTITVDKDAKTASVDAGSQSLAQGGTVITLPTVPDVSIYSVSIPVPSLSRADARGTLTINTDNGSVTLLSNMLTGVAGISGGKAEISVGQGNKDDLPDDVKTAIGDRPLIQLTLSIDGRQTDWSNPNAPVTVSIPYTPTAAELANPESIVVWYIDGSGNVVSVPNGRYDPATKTVTFFATHFSDYAVAYVHKTFNDVAAGAWYNKAVSFIAAREITSGTGNGNYSPDAKLTRGEFIVLMMRSYGMAPDKNATDNFADAGNTYYSGYLAAAKRLGITTGVGNNMYAPGKEITRQEMFTLLYNALKSIEQLPGGDSGKTVLDFSDATQISSWAQEAMAAFVVTGTVGGSNGKLNPTGTTTRAEMAQVLYNLLGK